MYYRDLEKEIRTPKKSLVEEIGPFWTSIIEDIGESWGAHSWMFPAMMMVIAFVTLSDVIKKRLR